MLADAEDVALSFEQNTLDHNKSVLTDKIRYLEGINYFTFHL